MRWSSSDEACWPPNKGMKLTSAERIRRSQLIPGVRPTVAERRCGYERPYSMKPTRRRLTAGARAAGVRTKWPTP
jgi:hypothetical protein